MIHKLNKIQNLEWKGLWIGIIWSIWDIKNMIVFKDEIVDQIEMLYLTQLKLLLWLKNLVFFSLFSIGCCVL